MKTGRKVWLVSGSRTAIGSYGRSLRDVGVEKMAEHVFKNALRRAGVTGDHLDGVYLGMKYQGNTYFVNPARLAALNAGLPPHVPAMTVHRECGSGMEAAVQAMKDIALGEGELYLAGGAESMSTVPYLISGKQRFKSRFLKWLPKFAPLPVTFKVADDGLAPRDIVWDPKSVYMSYTAQRVADAYGVSRAEMDEYALRSQQLAAEAIKKGRFACEIDPIEVPGRGFFGVDEHPRETSLEKLAALRSAFNQKPKQGLGGIVERFVSRLLGTKPQPADKRAKDITAGNASGINDGACALVLASDAKADALGLERLAQLVDFAHAGLDPEQMGLGPVVAIQKLLAKNNLTVNDIDLFEINEAFAAQYVGCEKLLGLDRNKVNVNGGAIALGHPIGMSGARIILSLAHELRLRGKKRGVAALCIGGGQGIAVLIEAPEQR
jgi:acetyl-CoA C-acetyltransferase